MNTNENNIRNDNPRNEWDMLEESVMFPQLDMDIGVEVEHEAEDCEPSESFDLSDDGDALASSGWGTDEDYNHGDFGGDE